MNRKSSWNANLYDDRHAFVWQRGEELLGLLDPKPDEFIVDLGCGTGHLTARIAEYGCETLGIDNAPIMIEHARVNYPKLSFKTADARRFRLKKQCNAVFSNAVLHWVKEQDAALECITRALKPGGRFVAEFGGKGNIRKVVDAIHGAMSEIGIPAEALEDPWYYPSLGEYAALVEQHGLSVRYATLFERPTKLDNGEQGLRNWLEMFAQAFLRKLPAARRTDFFEIVECALRPTLFESGEWVADYCRLRIIAVKT